MTGDQLAARILLAVLAVEVALAAICAALGAWRWFGAVNAAAAAAIIAALVVVGIIALIREAR